MLFETAVDGRYCKFHFPKQRTKKATITQAPLETKSTRKLCIKSQKLPKANVVNQKKKKHSFQEQNGFLTWGPFLEAPGNYRAR